MSSQAHEATLDVVVQCRLVTARHEGLQASQRTSAKAAKGSDEQKMAEGAEVAYGQALSDLTDCYAEAQKLHVKREVLDGVLQRNLPQEVVDYLLQLV